MNNAQKSADLGTKSLILTMTPIGAPAPSAKAAEEKNPETVAPAAEAAAESIDFSKVEIEPRFQDAVDVDTFSKCDFHTVKVKACETVKKSKKLLQFTLDDGTGADRAILSGIHAFYEPEQLVGKTLIAITNLPPPGYDGHRVLRHAAQRHPSGGRGRKVPSADGRSSYSCRCEALLIPPEKRLKSLSHIKSYTIYTRGAPQKHGEKCA